MSEGLEGMGRTLKIAALDDPEGPLSPRTEDDPTKSDEFDQDELARKSPGYLQAVVDKAVADAVASYEAKLAEKNAELNRRKAAESMLVRRTGELQNQLNRVPGANPAPAISRRNSMKWQTFVIGVLSLVVATLFAHANNVDKKIGDLAAHNADVDKKLGDLTTWYVDSQFGSPAALEGKTCLEITPQMQELGIERFVPIAERLPYADAETIGDLIKHNIWKISGVWNLSNSDAHTVVRLESPDGMRSVLAHVNPASVSVYTYKFATSTQEYTIYSWNYSWWCDNIKHPAIKEEQTAVK